MDVKGRIVMRQKSGATITRPSLLKILSPSRDGRHTRYGIFERGRTRRKQVYREPGTSHGKKEAKPDIVPSMN
ncbi:hypothetical protein B0H19DRAFT_1149645 [Mycena capillaripes]|nr:hypothetical protein B0H19DRAFT_1149645 [Mycena capillaripes]